MDEKTDGLTLGDLFSDNGRFRPIAMGMGHLVAAPSERPTWILVEESDSTKPCLCNLGRVNAITARETETGSEIVAHLDDYSLPLFSGTEQECRDFYLWLGVRMGALNTGDFIP